MRFLIPLGVFAVLVVFLYIGLGKDPRKLDSMLTDKPAPAFNLPQVGDATQMLSSEVFKGKVSLLNVWASWCVSCRQEHPVIIEIAKIPGISVFGLNWKDTLPAAREWLKRHGNPYIASAFDGSGRTGIDYGVSGAPETFIIDHEGVIRYKQVGIITPEVFRTTLAPLLKNLLAANAATQAVSVTDAPTADPVPPSASEERSGETAQ